MKGSFHAVLHAAILGVVCALLLTGAEQITGPYRQANSQAEKVSNILDVLEVPFSQKLSPQQLVSIFEANVREQKLGELNVYAYVPPKADGKIKAVAVPFEGPGLWGPIMGFLALEPEMKVIRGLTFYEQQETPGLGGEIASSWFTGRFEGKWIMNAEGKGGIRIRRGGPALARNEIDAITGATMTCEKLETILNATVEKILQESIGSDR